MAPAHKIASCHQCLSGWQAGGARVACISCIHSLCNNVKPDELCFGLKTLSRLRSRNGPIFIGFPYVDCLRCTHGLLSTCDGPFDLPIRLAVRISTAPRTSDQHERGTRGLHMAPWTTQKSEDDDGRPEPKLSDSVPDYASTRKDGSMAPSSLFLGSAQSFTTVRGALCHKRA